MIRLARPDEAGAVEELVQRAYGHWVAVVGRKPAPMEDDYPARIAAGQCWVLAAPDLAAISVLERHTDHLMLDNVAVEPARQGQRLGVVMIAHAIGVAAGAGLPEMRLYTNAKMERNVALYSRLGFRETERKTVGHHARVYMALRIV